MLSRRDFFPASLTGILVFSAGCGGDKRSKVSGVVTYKNEPVKGGSVYLNSDGGSFSSPIQSNGNYLVTDVPPGTYTVTIETETMNPDKGTAPKGKMGGPQVGPGSKGDKINKEYAEKMGGGGGGAVGGEAGGFGPAPIEELRKRYVKIPAKYGSKLTSGLTVEVTSGTVTKDLPLSD